MLAVKLVEAVVRIVGRVGFDRSRHVVDSGLLGACGLLGCCGPRKKRHRRKRHSRNHPYKATELQPHHEQRDSDSSYVPPVYSSQGGSIGDLGMPPRLQGSESRKGSTHSGAPPSVLRPEHAMRPYREDSEDEGFIMGAWQPSRKTGYAPIITDGPTPSPTNPQTKASQSTSTVAQSGFSKVGGGRAHIDTPYAITTGSTHTFPSIGQQSNSGFSPAALFDDEDSPPPSLSNVGRSDVSALPPGAMQPSHIRTKSQTAVIEDASILASIQGLGSFRPQSHSPLQQQPLQPDSTSGGLLRPAVMMGLVGKKEEDDDDDSEDHAQPKKKPWYDLRRSRVRSAGDLSAVSPSPAPPVDEELGGIGPNTNGQSGRSFVVIRKPQSSYGRLGQTNSDRSAHATT